MIKTSVIIVNHNHDKDTIENIESILRSKGNSNYEIIVVDNSDKKNLLRSLKGKYKSVKYIESENLGYGAGNNLGAKSAKGKYILILNPDCRTSPNTLKVLSEFLDKHSDAGAVSPNVTDTNKKLYPHIGSRELSPIRGMFALSFINKLFPKNPISKKYFMEDKPLDEIREADTIPGASFMIRRDLFEKIGGFDEKIFMYFEESDIGKRIKKEGYKLYITPKTEVMHKWDVDRSNENLQKIFNKSRFYYFKKHYGILNALLVETFCRISKFNVLFFLIFSLGVFIRFYKAKQLFILDSEIADNLLNIKNYYLNRQIPLIGPPTSHPWLYFGPLFYWLYGPVLILSKFNPISHLYFGLLISCLVIVINYFFVNKYWDRNIALVSSILISVSPILFVFSNNVRFYTYTVILIYPFLYFLFEWLKGKKNLFWVFFSLSVMLSFHFSVLVLIPALLFIFYINKVKINLNIIGESLSGFVIPVIPLFIHDSKNNFTMLKNLLLWFPYRILLALGIIHKNTIEGTSVLLGIDKLFQYLTNLFLSESYLFKYIIPLLLLFFTIIYIKKINKSDIYTKTLFYITLFSLPLLIIHGNTPIHYFLFLSPILYILYSSISVKILSKKYFIILTSFVIFLSVFNVITFIKSKNQDFNSIFSSKGYLYYSNQTKITEYIKYDSNGQAFSIKRIGENDQYFGNFAQNYQYMLWLDGNEPVMVGDEIIKNKKPIYLYTIVESPYKYGDMNYSEKFSFEDVTVLKSIYEK